MTTYPPAKPMEVASRIFAALKEHDVSIVDVAGHPEIVADFVAVGLFQGVGAVRQFFTELFGAFPDFEISVLHMLGDDEHAVVRWTAAGTFGGTPFQGIHATGRRAEVRGCDVMRFEHGKLRHNVVYYDGLSFARQTGFLPRQRSMTDRAITAAFNATTDVRMRLRRSVRMLASS